MKTKIAKLELRQMDRFPEKKRNDRRPGASNSWVTVPQYSLARASNQLHSYWLVKNKGLQRPKTAETTSVASDRGCAQGQSAC